MHSPFQKVKRKIKRKTRKIFRQITFMLKLGVLILVLFLMVILSITKPSFGMKDSLSENETTGSLEAVDVERAFIHTITPYAKEAESIYGVRPSILIAQAALESNWGESALSKEANNYFGIKAGNNGANYATKEYENDTWVNVDASFRRYDSMEESVLDYAKLLYFGTDWNTDLYQGVIQASSYKEAANEIKAAGYATDPNYAEKLIQIIEQYQLYELDA